MVIQENTRMFDINLKELISEEVYNKLGEYYKQPTFIYQEFKPIENTKKLSYSVSNMILVGELIEGEELEEITISSYMEGLNASIDWILNKEIQ
jgi:hypothetical protein